VVRLAILFFAAAIRVFAYTLGRKGESARPRLARLSRTCRKQNLTQRPSCGAGPWNSGAGRGRAGAGGRAIGPVYIQLPL
jgi:hypothetical protein